MVNYESDSKRFKVKRALKNVYEYLDERFFAQETSEVAIKLDTEQLIRDKIKHAEIKLKNDRKVSTQNKNQNEISDSRDRYDKV